jgi:hypothetical protein
MKADSPLRETAMLSSAYLLLESMTQNQRYHLCDAKSFSKSAQMGIDRDSSGR